MTGDLFSRKYLRADALTPDGSRFRIRLGTYAGEIYSDSQYEAIQFLKIEGGLIVPFVGQQWSFQKFFGESPIEDVLDSITLIYRQLSKYRSSAAKEWVSFVNRCFEEENLGYEADEVCGVHYKVDSRFAFEREATLVFLSDPQLMNVRALYERAFADMDKHPADTRGAVRHIFDSLETVAKALSDSRNLSRGVVEGKLKDLVLSHLSSNSTEKEAWSRIMQSFADWVDSVHFHRHGQSEDEESSPSESYAVFVLSTGSSYLRLLLDIRSRLS